MIVNIKDDHDITILIIAYGPNELIKMGRTSVPTGRRGQLSEVKDENRSSFQNMSL